MRKNRKREKPPMTQQEAVDYLNKVLNWKEFISVHQKIGIAIECVLQAINQNKEN